MDKKQIAERVYDEVMEKMVSSFKEEYIKSRTQFNSSEETDDSLAKKAILVQNYMSGGMDFHIACDQKDVYIGSEDSDFLYTRYILKSHSLTFDDWYEKRFRRDMCDYVEIRFKR
jgi:hypothetical protein